LIAELAALHGQKSPIVGLLGATRGEIGTDHSDGERWVDGLRVEVGARRATAVAFRSASSALVGVLCSRWCELGPRNAVDAQNSSAAEVFRGATDSFETT
jgi:hypothetical protein